MPTDKIIWVFWYQGYENAPELVRLCIDSWRKFNPDYAVNFLDKDLLAQYIEFPAEIDINREDLDVQKIAALSRLLLLKKYGGVWTDATVYCCKNLDSWLPEYFTNGFFAFRNPGPDRMISNWFIAADRDSLILQVLHREFTSFYAKNFFSNQRSEFGANVLKKLSAIFKKNHRRTLFWHSWIATKVLKVYPYFIFHYTFNKVILKNRRCRKLWHRAKPFDAGLPHRLQELKRIKENNLKLAIEQIDKGDSPVYKLDWRVNPKDLYWKTVLEKLSLHNNSVKINS